MNPGSLSRLAAGLAASTMAPAPRLVLLSLAAASGRDATARISSARLAERCGMSRASVRRHLKTLSEEKLISIEIRPGGVNAYRIEGAHSCEQGGAHSSEQGGAHPGAHRSSTSQVSTQRRRGGPEGRQPTSDPTPTERYEPPSDGKPLRAFLNGRSWREASRDHSGGQTDEDGSGAPVAALYKLDPNCPAGQASGVPEGEALSA